MNLTLYLISELFFLLNFFCCDKILSIFIINTGLGLLKADVILIDLIDTSIKFLYLQLNQNYTFCSYIFSFLNISSLLYTVPLKIINFTLKFLILISILVFVRGGIPRYRYDFLTKIGWLKLLSLTISFFLITLVLTYLLL